MKLYAAPLDFRAVADEFDVPTDFPPELHEEAANARDRFAGQRRDARDMGREDSPLKPATDAHLLDTSQMDIEAAFSAAKAIIDDVLAAESKI